MPYFLLLQESANTFHGQHLTRHKVEWLPQRCRLFLFAESGSHTFTSFEALRKVNRFVSVCSLSFIHSLVNVLVINIDRVGCRHLLQFILEGRQ